MEIDLLIIKYSEFLCNITSTLCRVSDDLYNSSKCNSYDSDYLKKGILLFNFILNDIERIKKNIVLLQDLDKEGV